ncbi:uncharacterized protein [Procambarus clarkii]|uniref:uncharacterized protein isoform X2 n=1 Tax=Procambarus clarkii TaxID=6728 RepID=UPI001E67387F|nr:uncharacterized protein LOC123757491 isoform X2 [Procambarus clarkii]
MCFHTPAAPLPVRSHTWTSLTVCQATHLLPPCLPGHTPGHPSLSARLHTCCLPACQVTHLDTPHCLPALHNNTHRRRKPSVCHLFVLLGMMTEKYLFNQTGTVEEIIWPGKAILTFALHNVEQRVLLWVKCFVHQGKNLEKTDSFVGKLSVGDFLNFDCHVYDKASSDNCQWYAATASKEPPQKSSSKTPVPRVMNQNGYISELDPGKGVILFDFYDEEQRVFFLRSKFYHFGKRPASKRSLKEFLSENDPLQFDAEMCEANEENFNCTWFASVVWKGKKPLVSGSIAHTTMMTGDDVTADDSISNVGGINREVPGADEFPSLGLPPGLTNKQGYTAFEVNSNIRKGKGTVLKLFNEECGIALWMIHRNTWETVFFHRKNSYLDSVSLSSFDIQESYSEGTSLEISAVPAIPEFPCRWIAHKAVAKC